jgi:hypothetical protein
LFLKFIQNTKYLITLPNQFIDFGNAFNPSFQGFPKQFKLCRNFGGTIGGSDFCVPSMLNQFKELAINFICKSSKQTGRVSQSITSLITPNKTSQLHTVETNVPHSLLDHIVYIPQGQPNFSFSVVLQFGFCHLKLPQENFGL